ncbi:fluoride efflux transporter CrcB [Angustibacter aerolatus]|uniref:Fluoride-specific ion channel FluC n=1 Tax=Angustibacter aerolatus TaxID=1162965 RepID=A0ABQ6JF69_9ACTN|nr:fluoride efflux transporter CrcB [Angustibacter aerolatus]GMA86073.1 hypothetical protein GCM10025868_13230 [Angustibacter aerolatus]
MTGLLVVVGAVVGAPTRYLVDRLVSARHGSRVPWGTITVNAAGSLVLGLLTGLLGAGRGGAAVSALVGTGFCGALTTFSTFSFETVRLLEERRLPAAVVNVVVSLLAGLLAFVGGDAAGAALGGG